MLSMVYNGIIKQKQQKQNIIINSNRKVNMQKFTAYYEYQLNGYINVNVWPEDPNAMYPEMWHQKFDGYSLGEVKNIIKDRLKQKYNKVKVVWERQH